MADDDAKKTEPEAPPAAAEQSPQTPPPTETPTKDAAEEKSVIPTAPPSQEKPDDSKALVVVQTKETDAEKERTEGSVNRDAVLARVATEKRLSLIRAWEESEKSKVENKSQKKLSGILAWENSQKANIEAELKKTEEQLEKMRAKQIEKMKNKIAVIHKTAEERRAAIEAKRGEDLLKAEEMAAKYRATGTGPKKLLGCF